MCRMYLTVFVMAVVALFSSIQATPIPIITDDPCRPPVSDRLLDVCIGLGILPTTAPTQPPLCLIHSGDKALLSGDPGPDGTVGQVDEPLLRWDMADYLDTNQINMKELYDIVHNPNYTEEDLSDFRPDILPDRSNFTRERQHQMRQGNISQLLYDHISLMAAYIRALDTVVNDQVYHLTNPLIENTSLIENTKSGMCRLLHGIHRVLRICDFDVEKLERLHTMPHDYQPPTGHYNIYMRDTVIVQETYYYVSDAHYDLSDLLRNDSLNRIHNCSRISPQELYTTTAAGST